MNDLSEAKRALLARRLKGLGGAVQEAATVVPRAAGAALPASLDQYRMWLHQSMQPDLPTYNEPFTLLHEGPLNLASLAKSLELYAARHEAWRTTFEVVDERVMQQVHSASAAVEVLFADVSGLADAERDAEVEALSTAMAVRPFDLTKLPLFRVQVTRLSETQDRVDFVAHHIILDGSGMRSSFLPELAESYAAFEAGREPVLPAVGLQFGDYSTWRAELVRSGSAERAKAYWRETLAGELSMARLPVDRSRPPTASQRGGMERFVFPQATVEKLTVISRALGGTLYHAMLATLEALLFRYAGQSDIIVGTVADARRAPELANVMGYLLDVVPVRGRPDAEMPFAEFLKQARGSFLDALSGADLPFDQIVTAVGAKRDPSFHPIFQTFFSFHSPAEYPAGWDLLPKQIDTGSAKFDLYIEAEERPEGVAACIIYNADIFEKATIQRMVGHWQTLLEAVVADPEMKLGQLPLLAPAERHQMLVEWNQTEQALPENTVVDLFREQAERTPDRMAVEFSRRKLTYAQLEDRAERFAALLRDAGAAPGKLVAVCLNRSENMLAALLGIMKTGATYLPLDPGTPLARITMCLEDAQPAVLLVEGSLVDSLPTDGMVVLPENEFVARALALETWTPLAPALAKTEDSAYIIHTSGSTGRPKGVELSHRSLVNVLLSMQREPGMSADDVLVAVTTVSFDIAVVELFLPIITGAKVVIAPRTSAMDPFELGELMDEVGCTILQATPATWRTLIAAEWEGRKGMQAWCGGEAMTRDLAEKLMARGLDLWNVYGPTETTVWSTCYQVQWKRSGAVPIGRPMDNTTIYILDNGLMPVPVGVPGELYIGGAGVAKGYRGQPELTAERFICPPAANGERIYRTGDYAVYRADGTIECQGRADNQVKVRGYRIELEEVELHLSSHPEVMAASARVWAEAGGTNRLSGYVVPKDGVTLHGGEVREYLRARVPEYMVPSDFIVLQSLPLTPNGKVDRKALPRPEGTSADRRVSAPQTEEEKKLAVIWSEVLQVPAVGRRDNFFDLGGHSLLLVQLFSRINHEFGTQLPITTIFDAQSLQQLAKVLTEDTNLKSLVPIQTEGNKTPLFVAHSYLLYRALSQSLGYDQPLYGLRELETDGDLSIEQRAKRYAQEMRKVQSVGPYRVAGWCAAGPLAVEIANQILLSGGEVSEIVLFDAWLPGLRESVERNMKQLSLATRVRERAGEFWERFAEMSTGERFAYIGRVVRRLFTERRDNFYVRHAAKAKELSQRFGFALPQFMHNTTIQTFAALRQFSAKLMPVHITLIRASETRRVRGVSESCGWEEVAERGVKVLWAPGDHESMFQGGNLTVTAKLVESTLDEPAAAA